jgi:hypothetical protein
MLGTNLDYLCAKHGQEIPNSKDDERLIQKALGVLQEDGLFAFIVFLESKRDSKDNDVVLRILKKSEALLNEIGLPKAASGKNLKEEILELTKDIDSMFLAKGVVERALTYALYNARALGK